MTSKPGTDPARQNKRWIAISVLIGLVSWAGLWGIVQLEISAATKTLLFTLLFVAVTSTLMPPIAYLNARFGRFRSVRTYRVRFVRQSIWFGVFTVVVAWLQMQRALTPTLVAILGAVFILIETFLITRELPPKET